jgi:hypothetical protein
MNRVDPNRPSSRVTPDQPVTTSTSRSPAVSVIEHMMHLQVCLKSRAGLGEPIEERTVVWMPTIALFRSVDTWQLVINTMTSMLALLLIALLQNSERRYDEALHHKIDALAAGLADLMEHQADGDSERLTRHVDELRAAVGLERRL